MEAAKCRLCGAFIKWVHSGITGALIPLNAEPDPHKGTIVMKDGLAHVLQGDLWEEIVEGPRYRSHIETCTDARVRKPRK